MRIKLLITFLYIISCSTTAWCGNIVYPWRSTTAIVKSGESFEVWFNADADQTINSVTLKGPFQTITTTHSIEIGSWVYDVISLNTYNRKITVSVPSSTPADRYDIILNTSSGQVISLAGVKVIKDYKSKYYILHFSDAHAFQSGYETTLNRISTIIDMANIINPEIAFNTGDNMYRPTEDRLNQFFIGNSSLGTKGLNKLSSATFTAVGNHDYDFDNVAGTGLYPEKSNWWNTLWGLQAYNFKYGNGRFMVINDGWDGFDPTKQIAGAEAWLNSVGSGNFRLGAAHIKDQEFVQLDNSTNLGLILVGHNHFIANENPAIINTKAIQYVVNSVRDNMEFNLFEVDEKTGTYTPVSGTTAQVSYIENPEDKNTPSLYRPKLSLSFSKMNDGNSSINTATLVNKLNFPIHAARVRFVMPLGSLYVVSKGQIEQSFNGTSVHVVDINVDLDANSTTLIDISPTNNIDLCPDDPAKIEPGLCGCGVPEGTCTNIPVLGVSITPASAKLNLYTTKQLAVAISPTNASNLLVNWTSDNMAVATVAPSGVVTAITGGMATITATTQDGGKTANSIIRVVPDSLTLQAEDAVFSGPVVLADQVGFHGLGFLDFVNKSTDYVTWTVNVLSNATYSLAFRYSLLSGSRPLKLTINNEVRNAAMSFAATGSWSNWGYSRTSQLLKAGNNTVTLTATGSSGGNYDELVVSAAEVLTGMYDMKKSNEEKSFTIYPNPFINGTLAINFFGFEDANNVRVKITNLVGQTVFQKLIDNPTHLELNLTKELKGSIYFISVESGAAKLIKKLILN